MLFLLMVVAVLVVVAIIIIWMLIEKIAGRNILSTYVDISIYKEKSTPAVNFIFFFLKEILNFI